MSLFLLEKCGFVVKDLSCLIEVEFSQLVGCRGGLVRVRSVAFAQILSLRSRPTFALFPFDCFTPLLILVLLQQNIERGWLRTSICISRLVFSEDCNIYKRMNLNWGWAIPIYHGGESDGSSGSDWNRWRYRRCLSVLSRSSLVVFHVCFDLRGLILPCWIWKSWSYSLVVCSLVLLSLWASLWGLSGMISCYAWSSECF